MIMKKIGIKPSKIDSQEPVIFHTIEESLSQVNLEFGKKSGCLKKNNHVSCLSSMNLKKEICHDGRNIIH